MHGIVNTEQAAAWNGAEGAHWAEHQDGYDAVNSGFNEPLLAAAEIGERDRVLDIGCGNGQVTRLAARRAALGSALGVDLSGPILLRARQSAKREGVGNAEFVQGDAQVHPFAAAGFDVALSRFGVMFFDDPVAAFRNVHRALRPGGRLAFLSLQPMERNEVSAVLSALAGPSPSGGDLALAGAFSLSDPVRTGSLLTRAGFSAVRADPVEAPQTWGADVPGAADFLAAWGPVRTLLAAQPSPEAARKLLEESLARYATPAGVRLTGAAWLVTATA